MFPKHVRFEIESAAAMPIVRGSLNGSLETIHLAAPADARIVGRRLEWIPMNVETAEWWPDGARASRALPAFMKLASTSNDQDIVEFVREFGVLALGRDGLPVCGSAFSIGDVPQLQEPWKDCAVSWEPVEAYRFYARAVKAIVILGTALKNRPHGHLISAARLFQEAGLPFDELETGDRVRQVAEVWQKESGKDWESWWEANSGQTVMNLRKFDPAPLAFNLTYSDIFNTTPEMFAKIQRPKFARWFTDNWIRRSGIIPTLMWTEQSAQMGLSIGTPTEYERFFSTTNSLFRLLVIHLASVICSGVPTATCDHCGELYFPSRRARSDQKHYCEICRATAPSRRTQLWRENARKRES